MGVAAAPRRSANVPQRGNAVKRRLRTDRDGDVAMDATPASARVRGAGVSKRGRGGTARDGTSSAPLRDLITNANTQQRILRQAAEGSSAGRGLRTNLSRQPYQELRVSGWESSKAASNQDRGIASLIGFLERKASAKKGSEVRIKKTRTTGNILSVFASEADVNEIVKLNTFTFAGVPLTIERATSRSGTPSGETASESATTQPTSELKELLRGVLERRYTLDHKLLNLSALAEDEVLKSLGVFQDASAQSKFFPALMKVCDEQFKTAQEKNDAIQAVVLSNNALVDIKAVTTLASTLPHLKNLDISNNQFATLDVLQPWRHKFRQLDHLIVTGNPFEQSVPDFNVELMKWYPTLRLLNGVQVRSDAEVAALNEKRVKMPPPTKGPIFRDEAQIAENFIRTFFTGYDTDRGALATMYYDKTSKFSLNVNTHALRDPNATEQDKPQQHEWEAYIKKSRNFKKITHLPARVSRLYTGTQAIAEVWQSLPVTQHASIDTNPQNWLFECHPLPGVPDPNSQSPTGVNGFLVTVHGEFYEINPSNGAKKHRSFDRMFILGPGGSTGVRVVSDTLVVRSYGGFQAFAPEPASAAVATQAAPVSVEAQMEAKVLELSQVTRLQPPIAKQCLEESGWDMATALANFERAKATLPADAFLSV